MKKTILIFALSLLIGFANAQQTGLFSTAVIWTNIDGNQARSVKVYVPTNYNANTKYKLVIGFHGLGDNPSNYIQGISYYTLNPYFGKVILACPNEGTASTSWFSGSEDFKIISAIIGHLDNTYNIDRGRVFVQGFSFGGKSVYLHGLDEADSIRGIIAHSPGFYNTADINNTCTNTQHCQHNYNYQNAPKVLVAITAGSGEYNLGLTEPYLDLAKKAKNKLISKGCDAVFFEDATGYHNLPPLAIVKQCWDHVNKDVVNIKELPKKKLFSLYPNPANSVVNIETTAMGSHKVIIMDLTGSVVKTIDFEGSKISFSVTDLSNGIYFYKIRNANGVYVHSAKFIVAK